MFNRKPYPYKERVVNVYYIYYVKNLAVINTYVNDIVGKE